MLASKERTRLRPRKAPAFLAALAILITTALASPAGAVPVKIFRHLDQGIETLSIGHAVANGQEKPGILLVASNSASKYKKYADYYLKKAKTAKAKKKTSEYKKFMAKYKSAISKYKTYGGSVSGSGKSSGAVKTASNSSAIAKQKKYAAYYLKKANQAKSKKKTSEYKKFMAKYKSATAKLKSLGGSVSGSGKSSGSVKTAADSSAIAKQKKYAAYFLKKADQAKKKKNTSEYKKFMAKYKAATAKLKSLGGSLSQSGGKSSASVARVQVSAQAEKFAKQAAYFQKKANQAKAKGNKAEYQAMMTKYNNTLKKLQAAGGSISNFDSGGRVIAGAKTVTVRNQSDFDKAMATAGGGTTIYVADGTYRANKPLQGNNVTLKAVNRGRAIITGILSIKNVSNGTVDGFSFISTRNQHDAIYALKASNLTISNNIIRHKDTGYGIRIHRSNNVRIINNVIEGQFNHAVSSKELVNGMSVINNRFIDCGAGCVEAGQTPDGSLDTEQTSTSIEISGNTFEGRNTGGKRGFRGIGIKAKNAVDVVIRNNSFTGSWNYPIQTSFGSVGVKNKSRLGHFGSKHPKKIRIENNSFNGGGKLDLAGRGRGKADTIELRSNRGSVSCTVRNMQTHGSLIDKLIQWGTVNKLPPTIVQSGNSFRC